MTIKEFAGLCGCNPQTLRYYDSVGLLKPARVDRWSGYRYYEEGQALSFVKIKNLQKAGFTIEEIKQLLDADNSVICRAFEAKIAEGERRLQEIREIRRSYQSEVDEIRRKIKETREKIVVSMRQYDPYEEFGIGAEEYAAVIDNVNLFFANAAKSGPKEFGYREFDDSEAEDEEAEYLDLLHNPNFAVISEKHGWARVKEFFNEIGELEDGAEYALVFRVDQTKGTYNMAFGNTVLGILLAGNPDKKTSLSCNVENTEDGQNHFWLLKRRD